MAHGSTTGRYAARMTRIGLALFAAIFAILPATAFAASTVRLEPALVPAFNKSQLDYTTKCAAGHVVVKANGQGGDKISVGGRPAVSGAQTASVPLQAGQRLPLKVNGKEYSIRCLPESFIDFKATGMLPKSMPLVMLSSNRLRAPGSTAYAVVIDRRGVPIWWRAGAAAVVDAKFVGRDSIGYWDATIGGAGLTDGFFDIMSPSGQVTRRLKPTNGQADVHEATLRKNGNWYLLSGSVRDHVDLSSFGGNADSSVFDGEIEEQRPNGTVAWAWNAIDHLPLADTGRFFDILTPFQGSPSGGVPVDLQHFNSVEDDGDGGLIVSARHHDAVYRMNKSNGEITWKLGGVKTSKSLKVIGDKLSYTFGGQHDARLDVDGTITVYDNGTGLAKGKGVGRPPRATRWRINTANKTATLVETIADDDVGGSLLGGGARRMADKSWLVAWSSAPFIKAYSKSHKVLFTAQYLKSAISYRAVPAAKGQLTRSQLVRGMDAMSAPG